jgi:hypothetical protein
MPTYEAGKLEEALRLKEEEEERGREVTPVAEEEQREWEQKPTVAHTSCTHACMHAHARTHARRE